MPIIITTTINKLSLEIAILAISDLIQLIKTDNYNDPTNNFWSICNFTKILDLLNISDTDSLLIRKLEPVRLMSFFHIVQYSCIPDNVKNNWVEFLNEFQEYISKTK